MEWGILVVLIIMLLISYVIVQETRAQMHWRGLVAQGDVGAIRQLIETEVDHWKRERVPRGVAPLLWHGVQTVELLDVTADAAHVSCSAEGEYALLGGQRVETRSPLEQGKSITMKLAEMLLYDVPNVRLDRVQIDVYTSYRDQTGAAQTRCILSTLVRRSVVERIDWDGMTPQEFVELTAGHHAGNGTAALQPVEPLPWDDNRRPSGESP